MAAFWKKMIPNDSVRKVTEWLLIICLAGLLAFLINTFGFRTANVMGDSMLPTLTHGDVVLVDRFSYRVGQPQYDDIVVFPYAGDPSNFFIKRVIGLPGDVIDWQDGFFLRNGERLGDEFSLMETNAGSVSFPLTVPEKSCFVLGDNRNVSNDSRFTDVGCVPFKTLIGRVSLRVMPFSKIGFVTSK